MVLVVISVTIPESKLECFVFCEGNGCYHCNFTGIELESDLLNADVVYDQKTGK